LVWKAVIELHCAGKCSFTTLKVDIK